MDFETVVYHTCKDTGDIDRIERNAPFRSKWKSGSDPLNPPKQPFLSEGFYFWEEDEPSAHWWGKMHYNPEYVVFRYNVTIDQSLILDLIGNPRDKKRLVQMASVVVSRGNPGHTDASKIPIGVVLDFMRDYSGTNFPYQGVRALDINRGQGGGAIIGRPFAAHDPHRVLPDNPQFILCLFKFSNHTLQDRTVTHPEHYCL